MHWYNNNKNFSRFIPILTLIYAQAGFKSPPYRHVIHFKPLATTKICSGVAEKPWLSHLSVSSSKKKVLMDLYAQACTLQQLTSRGRMDLYNSSLTKSEISEHPAKKLANQHQQHKFVQAMQTTTSNSLLMPHLSCKQILTKNLHHYIDWLKHWWALSSS